MNHEMLGDFSVLLSLPCNKVWVIPFWEFLVFPSSSSPSPLLRRMSFHSTSSSSPTSWREPYVHLEAWGTWGKWKRGLDGGRKGEFAVKFNSQVLLFCEKCVKQGETWELKQPTWWRAGWWTAKTGQLMWVRMWKVKGETLYSCATRHIQL